MYKIILVLADQCAPLVSSTKTEDQVKRGFLLDVVITQGASVFELLPGEDETLLVRWNSFLVLNLGLHIIDGIGRFDIQRDRFTGQRLNKDLHPTSETEDQVKSRLFLDVVITQGASVFKLLPGEDETLLIGRNAFLVLDLCLHVIDGIRRFNVQRDCLPGEGFDKNLHPSTETEDQVKGRFLLDVVVTQRATILQLLPCEDETLLIWWDPFLVLDLGFDVVDGVRWLNVESNGFSSEGFDKNLHSSAKTED